MLSVRAIEDGHAVRRLVESQDPEYVVTVDGMLFYTRRSDVMLELIDGASDYLVTLEGSFILGACPVGDPIASRVESALTQGDHVSAQWHGSQWHAHAHNVGRGCLTCRKRGEVA